MEKTGRTTRKLATTAASANPRSRTRKGAGTAAAPSHDQIARRAHELFVRSGGVHGRDLEFWLEAERQLKEGAGV